jgi:hypothetical protein
LGKEGFVRRNGDVGREHVNETKTSGEKSLEINAATKSSDDQRVWESWEGVGDPNEVVVFLFNRRSREKKEPGIMMST